jgi:subtilisin family serine protease
LFLLLFLFTLAGCNNINTGEYKPPEDEKPTSEDENPAPENVDPVSEDGTTAPEDEDPEPQVSRPDPLFNFQWYLENTGQNAFAKNHGTVGADINWSTIPEDKRTGAGVIVAIIDTGLEIAHEDLKANVVPSGSWDFAAYCVGEISPNCNDPTYNATHGDHGTSVAGIIAARSDNGIGISGIAGRASLKGFNLLADDNESTTNRLLSLGASDESPSSSDVSIFNQSFGFNTVHDYKLYRGGTFDLLEKQYKFGVENLRDKKGAIYVISSGNGFLHYNAKGIEANCSTANRFGLSCQNTNMDPENVIPYNITVGAVNANGKHSGYSTAGSSIWISAPGGGGGVDPNYVTGSGPDIYEPAIVTTDQSGCEKGYSPHLRYNSFQNGAHPLNSNCNYTATFTGTSVATPIVSGVIALLLAANNNLSWRDVKHILAKTARQVDPTNSGVILSNAGRKYQAELVWITNGAGYKFHNYYGFGVVNAKAAVDMASDYRIDLGKFVEGNWIESKSNLKISRLDTDGATDTIPVNYPTNLKIESVQIRVEITHPHTGNLGIKLTSPVGTKSLLLNVANGFGSDHNLAMRLASNAFYNELSNGNWKINVVDLFGDGGKLVSWNIRIYGHK